ncbi:MAG: DUF2924 domain-containing protein [Deltaproteobacteria bacterium]|nr:MAG: DUF2924 domain-containing protein [Deltaproteobacteria bacterium]
MDMNAGKEVARLRRMTVAELRERYAEVFGEETRSRHKDYLVRRIAWRLQANAEGDLSERARRRAMELAADADVRLTAPRNKAAPAAGQTKVATLHISQDDRLPMPGAVLTRQYKGRTIEVRVLPDGFEYEGEIYKSLSAVAKAVTGTHWNGYHFFQLGKHGRRK